VHHLPDIEALRWPILSPRKFASGYQYWFLFSIEQWCTTEAVFGQYGPALAVQPRSGESPKPFAQREPQLVNFHAFDPGISSLTIAI
jgi:hypothetical protein